MYGAELENMVSEGWRHMIDLSSTTSPNVSSVVDDDEHLCKLILYKEIQESRVRIWDILILIPNLLFLLFIVIRFNRARLKLRATSSPIFLAFYGLVICNVVISVIRCVVSMTVNAAANVGGKADKVLWVMVRFFLLSTEMSVVIFGLAFGHLDSRSSIRRVLLATSFIALAFTITQGSLELLLPDDTFRIPSRDFYVFGHGGMMFWFCSSLVFTTIYVFILILPWTRLRERLALPTRKSFYVYAGALATLNLVQSIGAGFLNYTQSPVGLCIVDFTAAVYLTLFTPLVYHTFLSEFFGVSQPSIMFSYKAQVDDAMDEDTVSLPHQQSFSSLRTDSDYIYQVHTPSIHVPLYDPQVSKSSPTLRRKSLYSLASAKDSKSSGSNVHGSQIALYRSASGARQPAAGLNANRGPGSVDYPLAKSSVFERGPRSSPDLRLSNPSWTTGPVGPSFRTPNSISNQILSSNASGSIYGAKSADPFARARKGSADHAVTAFASPRESTGTVGERLGARSASDASAAEAPALESTLKSILDSGTPYDAKDDSARESLGSRASLPGTNTKGKGFDVDKEKSLDVDKEQGLDVDKEQGLDVDRSDAVLAKTSPEGKGADADCSDACSEDSFSASSDASSAVRKLLPRYDSPDTSGRPAKRRSGSKSSESGGGLSDYLLSLTSPTSRRSLGETRLAASPSTTRDDDPSYAQTESL